MARLLVVTSTYDGDRTTTNILEVGSREEADVVYEQLQETARAQKELMIGREFGHTYSITKLYVPIEE